jgi:hypothetical protein
MTAGNTSGPVDPRVLAAALQAAMTPSETDGVYRAVLAEVRQALEFGVGIVLRCSDASAEVVGVYPAPIAGIDVGVSWSPLDAVERGMVASGEPSLDADVRTVSGDISPLTRLSGFGVRSALRVPLFAGRTVVGIVELFGYEPAAFTARDGIALEQYVRALGPRVAAPPPTHADVVRDSPAPAPY